MWAVFKFSHLSIAASDSVDGSGGIYRTKNPLSLVPCTIHHDLETLKQKAIAIRPTTVYSDLNNAHLNTRGWVLQERLLAPRVMNFCSNQVVWKCHKHICKEFRPNEPNAIHGANVIKLNLQVPGSGTVSTDSTHLDIWQRVVKLYAPTALTYQTDRLIAIAGLAREFGEHVPSLGRYLAGLWELSVR